MKEVSPVALNLSIGSMVIAISFLVAYAISPTDTFIWFAGTFTGLTGGFIIGDIIGRSEKYINK